MAQERVDKLKKRGYANAGIYNPQGVGGTHVMYVLHHADQPELYHKLPKEPQIDTSIQSVEGGAETAGGGGLYRHLRRAYLPLHRYRAEQGS